MDLMEDYKKEPGGKLKLKERNPKWINDDYVKFMRFGQHFIEKNGEGVLAFINPHGFLDNPTFRGMRWSMLNTYDEIYVLDLHGNTKKKETAPDGSADINVFDIMQGVSINLLIKTGRKKTGELAQVYHCDLYGKREFKYDFLSNNSIKTVPYVKIDNVAPSYVFVQKNLTSQSSYEAGFKINELFFDPAPGFVTCHDQFAISLTIEEQKIKAKQLIESNSQKEAEINYKLCSTNQWNYSKAKAFLSKAGWDEQLTAIHYRPFDIRWTIYNSNVCTHRRFDRAMQHFYKKENIGLIFTRQVKSSSGWEHLFISNLMFESSYLSNKTSEITYVAPLYLYPDSNDLLAESTRTPNLNMTIVNAIAVGLGLTFTAEKITSVIPAQAGIHIDLKENQKMDSRLRGNDGEELGEIKTFAPIDLLDYIYAVLHSPSYRETYKEFLKIDFPRVPYPKDVATFWQLVALGGELRKTHLLEASASKHLPLIGLQADAIKYPISGNNVVDKLKFEAGRVYINETQYFDGVPALAWHFYIGGYQPAQKWLKDRKGRALSYEDIAHYQKIIAALTNTHALMQAIDKINICN